jgi:hypothetical protein
MMLSTDGSAGQPDGPIIVSPLWQIVRWSVGQHLFPVSLPIAMVPSHKAQFVAPQY